MSVPGDLPAEVRDTKELLATLDQTLARLREFTDKLHAATEPQREGPT